jgi:hypothetical protein
MAEPKDYDEYLKRLNENTKMEGFGFEVTMTVPCPFCAAPDFQKYLILEVEEAMAKDTTCKECGRSAKAIYHRSPGSTSFEVVQTGGPDQPEWLKPKMRRL